MTSAWMQTFDGVGRPFALREVSLPRHLQPGEVLVQICLATICGSDLHTVEGRRAAPTPCGLGHEGVGLVLESNRSDIGVGQRVTWSLADSCGQCKPCTVWNLPQKCERLFKYGHVSCSDRGGLNSCYATHILLRAGTSIVPVPPELPDAVLAPINCALATVLNALESLPQSCNRVLIQGAGLMGVYAAAYLRQCGVAEVYGVDPAPERLKLLAEFGAIPVSDSQTLPEVDWVLEATGTSTVVPSGLAALRCGGHYVWVGMVHPQTELKFTGEEIVKKCLTIRGVHNYAPRHLQAGVQFLLSQPQAFPFQALVSPPLRLRDLDRAFELARSRKWLRVAIDPRAI